MDALDAIMTRRSVRKFTADDVSDSEVDVLLRAAMAAPSASNERPWRFVVVRDRGVARAGTLPAVADYPPTDVAAEGSALSRPGFCACGRPWVCPTAQPIR